MQDCLQIDLPPHADPYNQPRPVSVYPSMPLSPPGQTICQFAVVVQLEHGVTLCCVSCRQQLNDSSHSVCCCCQLWSERRRSWNRRWQ